MLPELKFLPYKERLVKLGYEPWRSVGTEQTWSKSSKWSKDLSTTLSTYSRSRQSSPWSLLETKQETVSYGPEEILFLCESGWQMEQVASKSHWLYQCWCFQESSTKDSWCPDELLHGCTCVLLSPWLHGCRFVRNRVNLPGKKPGKNILHCIYAEINEYQIISHLTPNALKDYDFFTLHGRWGWSVVLHWIWWERLLWLYTIR